MVKSVSCLTKGRTCFSPPIADDIFRATQSTCSSHDRSSSMYIPRVLLAVTLLTWSFPSLMLNGCIRFVILCLDAISMYSVLVTLILNLFAVSQSLTISSFELTDSWTSLKQAPVTEMFVSSANILVFAWFRQHGRSLIYRRNSKGPRIEPWGTPHVIIPESDSTPFTQHFCLRSLRYEKNQERVSWSDP